MTVYHVTSKAKYLRYLQAGVIYAPVRAWKTIEEADRFSRQTGRTIILRLKLEDFSELEGHRGMAVYQNTNYILY